MPTSQKDIHHIHLTVNDKNKEVSCLISKSTRVNTFTHDGTRDITCTRNLWPPCPNIHIQLKFSMISNCGVVGYIDLEF